MRWNASPHRVVVMVALLMVLLLMVIEAKLMGTPTDSGPFKCSLAQLPSTAPLCDPDDPTRVLIDAVVVINLKKRADRANGVAAALASAGLRAIRFPAVDGTRLSRVEVAMFNRDALRALSPGLVGNMMSHTRVWEGAAKRDGPTWVLEDDATFVDGIDAKLPAALDRLNRFDPEWDMVYTGRLTVGETRMLLRDEGVLHAFDDNDDRIVAQGIISPGPSEGMWGYILSPKGARTLLDLYASVQSIYDVDLLLHTPQVRNNLALYAFSPVLSAFDEEDAYSDDSQTNTATNLLKRANKLIGGGLFHEAIARYERALDLGLVGAEHAWAHTNMAFVKDLHMDDPQAAHAHFEAAVATQGVPPQAMADTLANFCYFLFRRNDFDAAETKCHQALDLVPNHQKAHSNLNAVRNARRP